MSTDIASIPPAWLAPAGSAEPPTNVEVARMAAARIRNRTVADPIARNRSISHPRGLSAGKSAAYYGTSVLRVNKVAVPNSAINKDFNWTNANYAK
jgi:hypothetical protein